MIRALIIDDEKKSRETLNTMLAKYCDGVTVIGMASGSEEGFDIAISEKPDLVFLDIEMPDGNGFQFLEKFEKIFFHVIFITAYDSYAIRAIRYHALDYILKPVDIDDLRNAVSQIKLKGPEASEKVGEFLSARRTA
jgi:two-component system LytT family response regulator